MKRRVSLSDSDSEREQGESPARYDMEKRASEKLPELMKSGYDVNCVKVSSGLRMQSTRVVPRGIVRLLFR